MAEASNKPDWSAQTGEAMTAEEIEAWRALAHADAVEHGCTFFQFSSNPDKTPPSYLFEGWKVQPHPQPAPHFHYTPAKEGQHNG